MFATGRLPLLFVFLFSMTVTVAKEIPPAPLTPPYSLKKLLTRGEELFRANNYREAVIFYFEALEQAKDREMNSKLHFRIGECLEGVRRYDFAGYHYKVAIRGELPEQLENRVMAKLEHLPALAQHEEATRLFKKAMDSYQRKDIRNSIDDYLESLRLDPKLMAKDESGLIDDSIQYLTLLSESKEKEPERLLKLAILLELRGETKRAVETFKQIVIIYPKSPEAEEAEEKLEFMGKKTAFMEIRRPDDPMAEVLSTETPLVFESEFDFVNPKIISEDQGDFAFTFKAYNDREEIPAGRFEMFMAIFGKGADQKEFLFLAEDGIPEKNFSFATNDLRYEGKIKEMNISTAYVKDVYDERPRPVKLFSNVKIHLSVNRK